MTDDSKPPLKLSKKSEQFHLETGTIRAYLSGFQEVWNQYKKGNYDGQTLQSMGRSAQGLRDSPNFAHVLAHLLYGFGGAVCTFGLLRGIRRVALPRPKQPAKYSLEGMPTPPRSKEGPSLLWRGTNFLFDLGISSAVGGLIGWKTFDIRKGNEFIQEFLRVPGNVRPVDDICRPMAEYHKYIWDLERRDPLLSSYLKDNQDEISRGLFNGLKYCHLRQCLQKRLGTKEIPRNVDWGLLEGALVSEDYTRTGGVIRVTVPENVGPGQDFQVSVNSNYVVTVKCPPNARPGQFLQITAPIEPVRAGVKKLATVPENVRPGQAFRVNVGNEIVRVTCPPNARPGDSVQFYYTSKTSGGGKPSGEKKN